MVSPGQLLLNPRAYRPSPLPHTPSWAIIQVFGIVGQSGNLLGSSGQNVLLGFSIADNKLTAVPASRLSKCHRRQTFTASQGD